MKYNKKSFLTLSLVTLMSSPTVLLANETSISIDENNSFISRTVGSQVDYKITTSGSNVNLRTGPGTNFPLVTKIPNNSKVTKISDFSNGKWAKAVFVGKGGQEHIGYMLFDEKYTSIMPVFSANMGEITGNRVVFRNGDNKSASKLGYFYKGNSVEVLENAKNGYVKIKVVNTNNDYKNNIGFVHSDYVRMLNN